MPYFVHHSWQSLMKIQTYAGVWPNQNRLRKNLIQITLALVMISGGIPLLLHVRQEFSSEKTNVLTVIVNITGNLIVGIAVAKLFGDSVYNQRSLKIYERVNEHFQTITDAQEAFVLKKYSENAAKFCKKYMYLNTTLFLSFMGLPIAKMLFELFFFYGEFERVFPYDAYYGPFDQDQYYIWKLLHIVAYGICLYLNNYSYDFACIMKVKHASALFEIVKIRLQEASGFLDEFQWNMLDFKTADNKAYEVITTAIDLHNEAFEMVQMIEGNYSLSFFLIILQNTIGLSGVIYILLMSSSNPFEFCRYLLMITLGIIHFYVIFSQGQLLNDSSSSVFDACYNVKWYVASKKTRMLLLTMMSRSSRPCEITGGRLFVISIENYGKMLKAGLSYFTIFTE